MKQEQSSSSATDTTVKKAKRSAGQPFPTPPPAPQREQRFPTPPPAPKREYPQGSDTTEERVDLSGHNGHTRADYIRELMSLGFSFVESVKKYGTCPAVIQRKLEREAKKAASLAKKAEAPPRRAKRKKAPSKVLPMQDEKPQEVDSDNDSDIGASERF